MYKLVFFVPVSHLEEVKKAVFSSGGGQIGAYSQCCWQTLGQGQFFTEQSAEPFKGKVGERTLISEYRVELNVEEDLIEGCLAALRLAHPYEEPVIDVMKLESIN